MQLFLNLNFSDHTKAKKLLLFLHIESFYLSAELSAEPSETVHAGISFSLSEPNATLLWCRGGWK